MWRSANLRQAPANGRRPQLTFIRFGGPRGTGHIGASLSENARYVRLARCAMRRATQHPTTQPNKPLQLPAPSVALRAPSCGRS
jgi:hypothetical protein